MGTIEVFATGDEIGTYSGLRMSGNSNGVKVTLSGVEPLGSSSDVFRIVITQVNDGTTAFSNGQFVSIYAWPETDPPSPPLYSNLNPQHDQFQGRASSSEHQIFTSPDKIVFDINGVTEGTMQYGPGLAPLRSEQLSFGSFSSTPPHFPCFAKGTLIETEIGPLPIETLRAGDKVGTADAGLQPIRWIGKRTVPGVGQMAPIVIDAGALGNFRRLVVSPQHRMLMSDWRNDLHFGSPQVLVAAKFLVNGTTIRQEPRASVTYFHLMFDAHQIIFAEGIPTESLHFGDMARELMDRETRAEIEAIFPEVVEGMEVPLTARTCLNRWEGALAAPDQPISTGVRSSAA